MRSKRSLLLIDDEVELLKVLTLNFELNGFECFAAIDTVEGEKILKSESIDLVICDVIMPGEGGLDFHSRVSKTFPKAPPFLFFSGAPNIPFSQPYPSGMMGFIFKPFSIPELIAKVSSILR